MDVDCPVIHVRSFHSSYYAHSCAAEAASLNLRRHPVSRICCFRVYASLRRQVVDIDSRDQNSHMLCKWC